MEQRDLSIIYKYRKPSVDLSKSPLLILIHGYGSNEEDLFHFSSYLPKEFHIVSIRGIRELSNFGSNAYSWFDISFHPVTSEKTVDVEQAKESRDMIKEFILEVSKKYNVDKENVTLMGFSQGAILSFAISLSYPELVKNIIPMSGYLNPLMVNFQDKEKYKHLNFFITHGNMDEVITPDHGNKACEILKQNDIKFEYREYPMVHTIAPPAFSDINNFILSILPV